MKKTIIIIFLLIQVLPIFSGDINDTTAVTKSKFSDERLDEFRNDGDFYYVKAQENQADFYDSFGELILKGLKLIFGNKVAMFILNNISYILLAIVLIILFFYFKRIKIRGLSYRDRRQKPNEVSIQEADIEEANFQELIKQAVESSNYPLAVRYHYLNMLKQLNGAGLIIWEPHKTNFDYFVEIKPEDIKAAYRKLSVLFEYIWYGEGEINKLDYIEVEQEFKKLKI
jgi:hypothetical protein